MARSPLKIDQPTLLLLLAQWVIFLGNFWLYFGYPSPALPIWLHVAIGIVPVHIAFTVWHETAHSNVSNRKWINNVVGVLGMLPYKTPYFMQRLIHLDHHKFLNEPARDPNQIYADGPFWRLPLRYVRAIGYARRMLETDPRSSAMRISDGCFVALVLGAYALAATNGRLLDLVLIWLVPVVIGKVIMDWYVNYLPHVGLPPDRFLGTRIFDVAWMTPVLLKHNYHAIHHLWPSIPWHRYPETFRSKHHYLCEHGVPIETRLFGRRLSPSFPAGEEPQPREEPQPTTEPQPVEGHVRRQDA
jgi:ring-1,2-phenylacetyl-CoA epoxidase subunit PaaE